MLSEGGRVSRTRRAARRCGDIRRLAAKRRHWKRARVAFRAELGRILAVLSRLPIDGEARP